MRYRFFTVQIIVLFILPYVNSFWDELCFTSECCNNNYISDDPTKFEKMLNSKICGQHLAKDIINKAVLFHWSDPMPNKPLVMSLHGPTGTGKTFSCQVHRDAKFTRGAETAYYKFISAPVHFPFEKETVRYKKELRNMIREQVVKCSRSLIVIEEIHLLPVDLIETLRIFLDSNDQLEGVDYRKATFILISNTGQEGLIDLAHNYELQGREQNEISYKEAERVLTTVAYSDRTSGFYQNLLIARHLIDYYIPFLPMKTSHVRCCIAEELKRRLKLSKFNDCNEYFISQALRHIPFYPESNPVFAESGCKKVRQAVSLVDFDGKPGCSVSLRTEL